MRKLKEIEVIEYSGYKGGEKPLSFNYQGKHHKIKEIITSYRQSEEDNKTIRNVFKIKTEKGKIFILYYDEKKGAWFKEE